MIIRSVVIMSCIFHKSMRFLFGLDWIGLDWIGLDWTGLDWTGLDWIGLDWIGLDWTGQRTSESAD